MVEGSYRLCLYLGVIGNYRSNVLLLDLSVNVVLCDLDNKRNHKQNTDEVGNHHKTVEGVGDIPSERRSENRTEDDSDNVDDAEDKGCLCTEEVFPSL